MFSFGCSFAGVRSVSFREDVLTIGTGAGKVNFFDIRAGKYLELKCGHTCTLTMGDGWLVSMNGASVKFSAARPCIILTELNGWNSCMYQCRNLAQNERCPSVLLSTDVFHVSNCNFGILFSQNHDDTYRDYFVEMDYPNAIYSHCYDTTGTKLFTAGGPLPAGLWGNYAALWHWCFLNLGIHVGRFTGS